MTWPFTKWMIVAEPEPTSKHGAQTSEDAAKAWNKQYLGAGINRYWTKSGALFEIVEHHDVVWGDLIHFRIIKVRDFFQGWS
ncbi:MAG: hypothetical protein ACOYB3_01865 [Azonexus sp.]